MKERVDTVRYFNGNRYMLRTRNHVDLWTQERYRTMITFAYQGVRGVPQERPVWPVITGYTVRA